MNIRKATLGDARKIAENNVLLAKESENMEIDYKDTLNGVKAMINDYTKGFYLVAEEKNNIIGQIMVTYEWSDWRGKNIWWLQSIYVRKQFRKKGIMKTLFEKVKQMAIENNVIILRLYVYKNNKNAIRVYEKIGMENIPYYIYQMYL